MVSEINVAAASAAKMTSGGTGALDLAPARPPSLQYPVDLDGRLGRAEWAVVDHARDDGRGSANPNRLLTRMQALLFGVSSPRPLANARLEALRRFAVKAWYRPELKEGDLRALIEAGFDSNDVWRILAHISARRGTMPEVEHWPAWWLNPRSCLQLG